MPVTAGSDHLSLPPHHREKSLTPYLPGQRALPPGAPPVPSFHKFQLSWATHRLLSSPIPHTCLLAALPPPAFSPLDACMHCVFLIPGLCETRRSKAGFAGTITKDPGSCSSLTHSPFFVPVQNPFRGSPYRWPSSSNPYRLSLEWSQLLTYDTYSPLFLNSLCVFSLAS